MGAQSEASATDATYEDEWGYRLDVVPEPGRWDQPGKVLIVEGIRLFEPTERAVIAAEHARRWEDITGGKATVVCRTVRRVVQYGEWEEPPPAPEEEAERG